MSNLLWIIVALVAVVAVLWKLTMHSLDRLVERALADEDVDPLLARLGDQPADRQPSAFNRAIRRMWDAYQRELALPLIRELVTNHADSRIAQYWLDQVRTVEPDLVPALGDDFVASHYDPKLAAKCGNAG